MRKFLFSLSALGIGVVMSALLLHVWQTPAYACSCAPFSTEEYVERADVIVVGTVRGIERDAALWNVNAAIEVERYLKGGGPNEVTADNPDSSSMCGYFSELSIGHEFLVFLEGESSPYMTNLCAGNVQLDGRQNQDFLLEVQEITGPSQPPVVTVSESGSSPRTLFVVTSVALGAAIIAALIALALFLRRYASRQG